MINTVIHAFENFKTPNIILKDIPVTQRLGPDSVSLVEFVETTSQQLVDNLATRLNM